MRENWYLVLGLAFFPEAVEDEALIESKIEEKRRFWTRNEGDIHRGADYRRYGQMVDEIKADMLGESNIRAELIKDACLRIYALIDPKLKMIRKVEISEDIIAKIAAKVEKEAKCEVGLDIVRSRVLALGMKVVASGAGDSRALYDKYYKIKPPHADKFNAMSSLLRSFHVGNLYDFLYAGRNIRKPRHLPCEQLRARAREKKNREYYKHDSISSSGSKLCVLSEDCFRDEASKRCYDSYLDYNTVRDILDGLSSSFDIAGELSHEAYMDFVEGLTEVLKNRREAEELLSAFCKVEKIPLAPFSSLTGAGARSIKVCRCGCTNDVSDGRKLCRACGLDLEIFCPLCSRMNDASTRVCRCGFPFENIDRALSLLELAESALQGLDYELAESLVAEAEGYWPSSPKAYEVRLELRELKQRMGRTVLDLRMACGGKNYFEASKLLERVKSLAPGFEDAELEEEIALSLAEAEKYKRAALVASGEEAVIEACSRAYEFCRDLPGIRDLLAKYPPLAPAHLIIDVDAKARLNTLSWTRSPSLGLIYYAVVRKEGAIPLSPEDGSIIGRVSTLSIVDRDISPGQAYFYAVFAERASVYSRALASVEPILNLFEISGLRLTAGDSLIQLEWGVLPHRAKVEIERRDPPGLWTRLRPSSPSSYVDRGLINDREYQYRVFLTYELGSQRLSTEGIFLSARPIRLPLPPARLLVRPLDEADFILEWEGSEEGEVRFYYSEDRPVYSMGTCLGLSELEAHLDSLIVTRTGLNQASFKLEGEEAIYILAASVKYESAVIGPTVRAAKRANLRLGHVGLVSGNIFIALEEPKEATGFVVLYRHDAPPLDISDEKSVKVHIPLGLYRHDGGLVIEKAQPLGYYFLIFAEFSQDGEIDYSAGCPYFFSNIAKREILYSLRLARRLFGRATVELVFEGEEGPWLLPDIDIYMAQGRAPMFKETAKLFCSITAREVKGSIAMSLALDGSLARDTYLKPFLRNEELSASYLLKMKTGSDHKIS